MLNLLILALAFYLGRSTQKTIILESEDRVNEVAPGSHNTFSVHLKNPLEQDSKTQYKYRFRLEGRIPEHWNIEIENDEIVLHGGEEKLINIEINVPEDISTDEWASIDFVVVPSKGKSEKINFLLTLREPEAVLETDISHTPEEEEFEKDKRIVTTVKISNTGEIDAKNKGLS